MNSIGIDALTGRTVLDGDRFMLGPVVGSQMMLTDDNAPEEAYPRIDRRRVIEPNRVGRSTRLVYEDQSLYTHLRVLTQWMINEMFAVLDRQRWLSGEQAISIAMNGEAAKHFADIYEGPLFQFYISRATSQAWHDLCKNHAK